MSARGRGTKAFAPGKLVLTGAYAVLEGAPAIVVATSRGAHADGDRTTPAPTPEVVAALGDEHEAPHYDASALFLGARKLGLGASAAIVVASIAVREAEAGADLAASSVRDAIFARARAAHAAAQSGGSGVDVAASVHGGVLEYSLAADDQGAWLIPTVRRVALPTGTVLTVFACGTSARTTELRGFVDRLATRQPSVHRKCMDQLGAIARDAARAVRNDDRRGFVDAIRSAAATLAQLGTAAEAPIVPEGFTALADAAAAEGAAFCVSGAGGGDVAAFVGSARPSESFLTQARARGLFVLDVDVDEKGVRIVSQASAQAAAPREMFSSS